MLLTASETVSSYSEHPSHGAKFFSIMNAFLAPAPAETESTSSTQEAAVDAELVLRAQSGDKQAFDLLVKKYQHRIIGLANRFVNNPDTALDVAQDCFIKAYRALPNFRGDSAFYTWLYRICINTAKNYLSSAKRRPPSRDILYDELDKSGFGNELNTSDSPERLLIANEIQTTIDAVLNDLPKDLRMALLLRETEGLSYEDIAEAMSCPIGTVRSRIFRAREAIEKRIAPLLEY